MKKSGTVAQGRGKLNRESEAVGRSTGSTKERTATAQSLDLGRQRGEAGGRRLSGVLLSAVVLWLAG
jgi:hypothetical protein